MNEISNAFREMAQGIKLIAGALETISIAVKQVQELNDVEPTMEVQEDDAEVLTVTEKPESKVSTTLNKEFSSRRRVIKPFLNKNLGTTELVLDVIAQSKKGITTAEIIGRTGLGLRAVQNTIFKLRSNGQIKNRGRGVYITAE